MARGVDLFDCVMPSRNARHGHLFTWDGVINLINAKYQLDDRPIDHQCDCPVCRQSFSRAYIRHLLKAGEMLGMRLAVMHNLYFYNTLMERIRKRWITIPSMSFIRDMFRFWAVASEKSENRHKSGDFLSSPLQVTVFFCIISIVYFLEVQIYVFQSDAYCYC